MTYGRGRSCACPAQGDHKGRPYQSVIFCETVYLGGCHLSRLGNDQGDVVGVILGAAEDSRHHII